MSGNPDVQALLDHIGMGHSGNETETISELMNFTLQCLGGIRILVMQKEKTYQAELAAGTQDHFEHDGLCALREAFESAVKLVVSTTNLTLDLSDLDPSRHLIESFPDQKRISTNSWLPIHWAIIGNNSTIVTAAESNSRLRRVSTLGTAFPETVKDLDKEGRSILHYAARVDSPDLVEVVATMATPAGRGPDFPNRNGALPLHNAARFCTALEVSRTVLQLFPPAIQFPNNDGTLPFHWAAAKCTDLDVLTFLQEAYPAAISTQNHEGYLPLHSAAQNCSLEVVKHILKANPGAIRTMDSEGGFPLHHACYFNTCIEVVETMYEEFPEAIKIPQVDGTTPLHLAACNNESTEIMSFILSVHPSGANSTDSQGWLPLHCLMDNDPVRMSRKRLGCVDMLSKGNPAAITSMDIEGKTPLDIAVNKGHSKFLQRYLFTMATQHHLTLEPQHKDRLCDLNWRARRLAVFAVLSCAESPTTAAEDASAETPIVKKVMMKLTSGACDGPRKIDSKLVHYVIAYL